MSKNYKAWLPNENKMIFKKDWEKGKYDCALDMRGAVKMDSLEIFDKNGKEIFEADMITAYKGKHSFKAIIKDGWVSDDRGEWTIDYLQRTGYDIYAWANLYENPNFFEHLVPSEPRGCMDHRPFCETVKEDKKEVQSYDFVLPKTYQTKLTDQEATDKLKKLQEKTKRKMKEIMDNSDMKRADMSISLEKKKK